jgi:hypothetical protein
MNIFRDPILLVSSVAQQPNSELDGIMVEVSSSHSLTLTHSLTH